MFSTNFFVWVSVRISSTTPRRTAFQLKWLVIGFCACSSCVFGLSFLWLFFELAIPISDHQKDMSNFTLTKSHNANKFYYSPWRFFCEDKQRHESSQIVTWYAHKLACLYSWRHVSLLVYTEKSPQWLLHIPVTIPMRFPATRFTDTILKGPTLSSVKLKQHFLNDTNNETSHMFKQC